MEIREARSYLKFVRISPRKVKIVLDLIRGKDVQTARGILKTTPKAACEVLIKLLDRACADADKILAKDPQNPDALHLLGVAAAHRDQSYIKITFPYALDAVKIKKERTQNDDEFYNFLNMALKISFEVLDECLNSANAVELNSYLSYNEKSIQEKQQVSLYSSSSSLP